FDDDGFTGNAHIVRQHCGPHATLAENLLDDITAALQMPTGGQRTRGGIGSSDRGRGGCLSSSSHKGCSRTRCLAGGGSRSRRGGFQVSAAIDTVFFCWGIIYTTIRTFHMCCLLSSTLRSTPFIYFSADYTVFPGESRESKCIHYLS